MLLPKEVHGAIHNRGIIAAVAAVLHLLMANHSSHLTLAQLMVDQRSMDPPQLPDRVEAMELLMLLRDQLLETMDPRPPQHDQ